MARLAQGVRGALCEVAAVAPPDRLLDRARPPARRRRKKGGEDHALIEPLLPGADGSRNGRPRLDDRKVLNGIFFILRTGSPWRDLPERYGPYTTAYNRFNPGKDLPSGCDLVADRGYDAKAVLGCVAARGGRAHIPTCRDRKVQRSVDPALYRHRNLVKRFFNKLKHFRRIATRYDKLARNFLSAVLIASTRLRTRFESTT